MEPPISSFERETIPIDAEARSHVEPLHPKPDLNTGTSTGDGSSSTEQLNPQPSPEMNTDTCDGSLVDNDDEDECNNVSDYSADDDNVDSTIQQTVTTDHDSVSSDIARESIELPIIDEPISAPVEDTIADEHENNVFHTIPSTTTSSNRSSTMMSIMDLNPSTDRTFDQSIKSFLRMLCTLIRFLLLCPFVLVLNTMLVLFLCVYISLLLLSACFCPRILERFFTAEHAYTEKQIQANLLRRELLHITIQNSQQRSDGLSSRNLESNDVSTDSTCISNLARVVTDHVTGNTTETGTDRMKNDFYEFKTRQKIMLFSKPLQPKETKAKNKKHHSYRGDKPISWTRKATKPTEPDIESGQKTEDADSGFVANNSASLVDDDMYESGEGCDICMSSYVIGDVAAWSRNPKCSHVFHVQCITDWVSGARRKKTCPCCRNDFIYEIDKRSRRSAKPPSSTPSSSSFASSFSSTANQVPPPPNATATTLQASSTPGFSTNSSYLDL